MKTRRRCTTSDQKGGLLPKRFRFPSVNEWSVSRSPGREYLHTQRAHFCRTVSRPNDRPVKAIGDLLVVGLFQSESWSLFVVAKRGAIGDFLVVGLFQSESWSLFVVAKRGVSIRERDRTTDFVASSLRYTHGRALEEAGSYIDNEFGVVH